MGKILTTWAPLGRRGVFLLCMCVVGRPSPAPVPACPAFSSTPWDFTVPLQSYRPCVPGTHSHTLNSVDCSQYVRRKHIMDRWIQLSVWHDCWRSFVTLVLCNVLLAPAEGASFSPLWQLMLGVGFLGQSQNLFSNRHDSSSTKNSHWKLKCIYKFRFNFTYIYILLLHKMISWKL